MIGFLVVALLVFLAGHNITSQRRFKPCLITMQITLASCVVYETPLYNMLAEGLGFYICQMIVPFAAILLLRNIPGKLATVLTVTSAISILSSLMAFWFEGNGLYTLAIYQLAVWILLAVELFSMLSPRLTSGVHGVIHRLNLGRDHSTVKLGDKYSRNICTDHNSKATT